MRGYSGIGIPSSACIRFVRNADVDDSLRGILSEVRDRGVRIAYVGPKRAASSTAGLVNLLAGELGLKHAPYEFNRWVCFLDDLGALAYEEQGLVIIIDSAWMIFTEKPNEMFDLVEAFLIQFHHWSDRKKPCYLCFQMEPNEVIAGFATGYGGVGAGP